jgi:hypothetical protein
MALSMVLRKDEWALERNGTLHFKQDQLFHLHRLSLLLIGVTGQRQRFGTYDDLERFLSIAQRCGDAGVQRQLAAVQSVMPFEWQSKKSA